MDDVLDANFGLESMTMALGGFLVVLTLTFGAEARGTSLPNIVVFFADDLGYGDLGCFGAREIATPNIDRLAQTGRRFTDFYVAQPVCTASRAALLTGCYSNRVGMEGALNPTSKIGIHPREVLLPQILKQKGYQTAILGKWHLGNQPQFSPLKRGFDHYFGIPYSNDCSNKYHPVVKTNPPLPLFENDRVVAYEPDQSLFTQQITSQALQFLLNNRDRPFFLYVPYIMPHVPIFPSSGFRGKSKAGVYGDVVEELDWSVGQIVEGLKKLGLDGNTLVLLTSDNGPFLSYGEHAGSAGRLRGGKLSVFEGGVRVPFIVRWPGRIAPASVCREACSTIDLTPTLAKIVGGELPKHTLDGHDIQPLLRGDPEARSPHEALFFYAGTELHALRSGRWKLHLPHPYLEVNGAPGRNGKPANFENLTPADLEKSGLEGIASRHGYRVEKIGQSLFDLENDLGETKDVSSQNGEVVARMLKLAERMRGDLGDSLTNVKGSGVRPAQKVD